MYTPCLALSSPEFHRFVPSAFALADLTLFFASNLKTGVIPPLTRTLGRTPFALFLGALALACPLHAQDARQQIDRQVATLEKRINSGPDSDENWKGSKPNLLKTLATARDNLTAGRTFLGLAQLGFVGPDLTGLENLSGNPEIVKSGASGFEKEWKRRDLQLADYTKRYASMRWDGKPAALRAIAEASWVETRALLEASRPYAAATQIQYGLYYLGRSQGNADYAFFCQGLNLKSQKPAPRYRSLAPEIEVLQSRVIAVYQPPASIDHHAEFIQINAAIKTAKELDAAQLYFGSLYKYLEGVRLFAMLDAKSPEPADASKFAADSAEFRKTLADAEADASIGEIFLERAESAIAGFNIDKSDPSKLKPARVALEAVLPAYLAAVDKPLPAATPAGHVINVTLVRWPYT